jgi:hypothetical protein
MILQTTNDTYLAIPCRQLLAPGRVSLFFSPQKKIGERWESGVLAKKPATKTRSVGTNASHQRTRRDLSQRPHAMTRPAMARPARAAPSGPTTSLESWTLRVGATAGRLARGLMRTGCKKVGHKFPDRAKAASCVLMPLGCGNCSPRLSPCLPRAVWPSANEGSRTWDGASRTAQCSAR